MPNERLTEADLIARFSGTRATVRSALTRLSHDGLIVLEFNHGARVRMISLEEAIEILEARAVLEALAAGHAANRASDEEVQEIKGLFATMTGLLDEGDMLGYSECNRRLHATITSASYHKSAQHLLVHLKAQIVRFQFRTILVPGRPAQSLAEHGAIVDAIVRRDSEAAERATQKHLLNVARVLEQVGRTEPAGMALPTARVGLAQTRKPARQVDA